VTFVRTDQWVAGWHGVATHVALREALRRFLAAYGQAQSVDFAHWFGTSRQTSEALVASLRDELEEVELGGAPRLAAAHARRAIANSGLPS
jgi:hypothetical protein